MRADLSIFTERHMACINVGAIAGAMVSTMMVSTIKAMVNFQSMFLLLAFFNAGAAVAQSEHNGSLAERKDCSNISVDYRNNTNLTQQEKIELMDKALFHSLNKYEGCQSMRAKTAASGGGAGGGQGAGSQSGEGGGSGKDGAGGSTASSEMSGTQTPAAQESSSDSLDKAVTNQGSEGSKKPVQNVHVKSIKGSGKIPDDIPNVDNDSILEAQIRQAAMDESDAAIKAKLWNEYRKYKGLPVQ